MMLGGPAGCAAARCAPGSVLLVVTGWVRLQPSRYRAIAFRPAFHASMYAVSNSSTLASAGWFTVLEIAPEMKGWAAAIMRMWPMALIERVPLAARKAQSKTGRWSQSKPGAPSMVSSRST